MSRRCQRNHHRPKVARSWMGVWESSCACGWHAFRLDWRTAIILALAHSQELS